MFGPRATSRDFSIECHGGLAADELVEMGVQQFLENSSSCPMLMVKVSIPAMPQNGRFLSWKVRTDSAQTQAQCVLFFAQLVPSALVANAPGRGL